MSTTVDVERIESLEAQVKRLDAALVAARKIRTLFLIAVLALMGLIIYMFMGLFHKLTSQSFQAAVASEAQSRFEQNQERYLNEVKSVVDKASPLITQAFYQQTKQDMPKYTAALDQQREIFTQDLQSQMDAQLRKKYHDLLAKYEARLVREFPELEDEKFRAKVMHSLDKAVGDLASRYYTDQMGLAIGKIYEGWDRFPPADKPGLGDPQLGDQLIGTLLELVSHRLSE